ncbi:hypothetical protein FRB95_013932 [Tulasnella sp. JGI-2019a]|nr:hypothetical protein FRB95_013932 [Tulasnella sp. JGI-2019a]
MVDMPTTLNVGVADVLIEQDEDMLSDHEEDETDHGVGFHFDDDNMDGMETGFTDAS